MTLLSVLGLLFLVVASLYVPPVQRAVVKTACDALSDSAMSVSVSDFRLRFPLRLDLSDVCVVTGGDTLCALHALHTEESRIFAGNPRNPHKRTPDGRVDNIGEPEHFFFCF